MDIFTCECGKSFGRKCDISKHQRYHCRGAPPETGQGNICSLCSREFNTRIGLRQHQRKAHPVEYNDELESSDERAYTTWSALEDYELAVEEIAHDGVNINQHLARIFSHRTLDSIKSHRRSIAYKDLVKKIRLERSEAADETVPVQQLGIENRMLARQPLETVMENSSTISYEYIPEGDDLFSNGGSADEPDAVFPQQLASNAGPQVVSSQSSPNQLPPSQTATILTPEIDLLSSSNDSSTLDPLASSFTSSRDSVGEYISQLVEDPGISSEISELVQICLVNTEEGSAALNMLFDKIIQLACPKATSNMQHHTANHGDRKRYRGNAQRAFLYKKAQKLYRSNRAHLANSIFEDSLNKEVNTYPDIVQVEEIYRQILETPSIADSAHISDFVDHNIQIYSPIKVEEIKEVLAKRMSEAAGVDHLTPSDLKKVPNIILACLFNLMLFLGDVPTELKRCRTTLIPKGNSDLQDVNNWRPITVTSILLRIFNKILAGRFKKLPFHYSQRGFLEVDGTLANTFTLQATIKTCRRLCKPHCVTTLDLRKAFDSVSRYSIQRALQRFQIEEKIIRLIMNTYADSTTNIKCGPNTTGNLKMLRGVKQGDPLSPLLFNMVMDELLVDLHKLPPGISIEGASLTALVYSDDLVLFSEGSATTQSQVSLSR